MKKILTYGTFDTLHYGHVRLLQRAKALGTELHVGLSSDRFNALKGKRAAFPYEEREELLKALKCVDNVFPEDSWEQKAEDVMRLGIDTFVMGDDWTGKFDFLKQHCEVVYLTRTPGISSTQMRTLMVSAARSAPAA